MLLERETMDTYLLHCIRYDRHTIMRALGPVWYVNFQTLSKGWTIDLLLGAAV